jgi:hypothetical protein
VIDADASPCGYIAWHNHHTGYSRIRTIRPVPKNEKFGVQRMEMLAIYFALADNLRNIRKKTSKHRKGRVIIAIRSDSKSTVEQLRGLCQIRDTIMRRIFFAITTLVAKVRQIVIIFSHLKRSYNTAGLLLEQRKMNELKCKMLGNFDTLHSVMPAVATHSFPFGKLVRSSSCGGLANPPPVRISLGGQVVLIENLYRSVSIPMRSIPDHMS